MPNLKVYTVAEQLARYLEEEIVRGRWQKLMPGRNELAVELGFNSKTVESALRLLQKKGVLVSQGAGRKRLINRSSDILPKANLRVAILILDQVDRSDERVTELYHMLEEAGYMVRHAEKSMSEIGEDTGKLAELVKKTEVDAWIIASGPRFVLDWFCEQKIPAFALFGRRRSVPMPSAGPDKLKALSAATSRLLELGHRRICFLCRDQRRSPEPGFVERAFLEQLREAGLRPGKFNLPDWEESKQGFQTLLDSLFGHTPPTALIVDEAFLFNSAYFSLTYRGLKIPDDVSLVCTDNDPRFVWCRPSVAHIEWDHRPVLKRVVKWVNNISKDKEDRQRSYTKAIFVEGETIGPAKS